MSDELQTPRDFVQSGWDYVRTLGADWVALSKSALEDLAEFEVLPVAFNVSIDPDLASSTFVRPVLNLDLDVGDVDVVIPETPTFDRIPIQRLPEIPREPDFGELAYVPPGRPDIALPTDIPNTDVTLDEVIVGEMDAYVLPALPTLYELDLPDAPDLSYAVTFEGVRPTTDGIALPDSAFNWQEIAYSSTLLDSLRTRLDEMLDGGLGLPAHVTQAIYDAARQRSDGAALKRVQESEETLGSRGIYDGGGYIHRRLEAAREGARAEGAGVNRDVTIRALEIEIESIRFAVAQCGALEATLIQQNGQINQRALEAAKIASDIQFNVVNAAIALVNADAEIYKADAQVFRERIQAKIAQAEVYRVQIEGQKAIGEMNATLVRAYTEELRSIETLASIYRANIEAARVRGEINTQRIQQAKLRVEVFGERVRAFSAAQDGYRAQVESELGRVRGYEVLGNIWAKRVEAVRTRGDYYIQQNLAELRQQAQEFEAFRLVLDTKRAQLAAQVAGIDARLRSIQAGASIYGAEAQVATAEAASKDRAAALVLEQMRATAQIALANVNAKITQMDSVGKMYLQELTTRAQVASQLASSTLSGVNFGASYNGSLGVSYGKSASWGYSGDTPDYAGIAPNGNF